MPTFDHPILAAARDRSRGSSEVAAAARDAARQALAAGEGPDALAGILLDASMARPEFAALHDATATMMRLAAGPAGAASAWARYCETVAEAEARCVEHALSALPDGAIAVATHSRSGTVAALLSALHGEGRLASLTLTEAPPGFEGKAVARAWERRVPTRLVPESAIEEVPVKSRLVAIGCDHVVPGHGIFANKAGTRRLLAAAQRQGVPSVLLATRQKVTPVPLAVGPPFETVPLSLVTSLVTDAGPGMPDPPEWPDALIQMLHGQR